MSLKNKAVVVTGASSSMGRAIRDMFAREGARVLAVAMGTQAPGRTGRAARRATAARSCPSSAT